MPSSNSHIFQEALEYQKKGQRLRAQSIYQQILRENTTHIGALNQLALLAQEAGEYKAAVVLLQKAVELHQSPELYYNLGKTYQAAENYVEALNCFNQSLQLKPDFVEVLDQVGLVLEKMNRISEAEVIFRRGLIHDPKNAELLIHLGLLFQRQGCFDDSMACYKKVYDLNPSSCDNANNLAFAYYNLGMTTEAIELFRESIRQFPENVTYHYNLSNALLRKGLFEEGFKEYSWRWKSNELKDFASRRGDPRREWKGQEITGKTLLIHGEQGYGDTLQFCRYASLAAERGIHVILYVPQPLVRLLKTLAGVSRVIPYEESPPTYDYYISVIDMAMVFGTRPTTIPSVIPYLSPHEKDLKFWRNRLSHNKKIKKIGLSWSGNPREQSPNCNAADARRSIPFELFSRLLRVPGFEFYSLQKEGPKALSRLPIIDYMGECHDFADTAAFLMNLDLIITVDTAIVHLAGALGKPVWLLNRFDSCWRWLEKRHDTPWYPTVRIFQQIESRHWEDVLDRVERALIQLK